MSLNMLACVENLTTYHVVWKVRLGDQEVWVHGDLHDKEFYVHMMNSSSSQESDIVLGSELNEINSLKHATMFSHLKYVVSG